MKASEIMVKDWLKIQYKNMAGTLIEKIFQVGHIEDYNSFIPEPTGVYYIFAKGQEHGNMGRIENMMGIPLTAEILEKNGFTHRNADKFLTKQSWTCECGGYTIHAKYNFGFLYFNIYGKPLKPNMFAPHATMHIQYVHELQHALRLCGLNELADNFKV